MVDRINHFPSPAADPVEARKEAAERPLVSPLLIEDLRRKFPRMDPQMANSADQAHWVVTIQARERGQLDVIRYLEKLLEEQR